ncbi:MAG TPA: DJ-1/PfpI family protein [Novosphingobium sp.]|nr:DJ-1/PfpI family protein [Novosphingobium sp.]
MSVPLKIVIPLYDGVTELDFTGPYQFLVKAPDMDVVVASMSGRPVNADGLTFANLADLQAIEACDVLCVPGGSCHLAMEDEDFLRTIRRLAASAAYLTSVCNGSLILAAAGLLVGKRAACHWSWREMLSLFGAIPDDARVVHDGNVMTGGGVTAGIDFALALIAELRGEEVAQSIQLNLEYAPDPPFNAGRPEIAPAEIFAAVAAQRAPMMAANRVRVERVAERVRDWLDPPARRTMEAL